MKQQVLSRSTTLLFDKPINGKCATSLVEAFPMTTRTSSGKLICVYREGKEKHSYDGVLKLTASEDGGQSWSEARVIVDERAGESPWGVVSASLAADVQGDLILMCGLVDACQTEVYLFSEEGREFRNKTLMLKSTDEGLTWKVLHEIDLPAFHSIGITTNPLCLPNGELMVHLNLRLKSLNQGAGLLWTRDGEDLGEIPQQASIHDPTTQVNYDDIKFCLLPNGEITALCWTYEQGSEREMNLHQCFSRDNGRTWSQPVRTPIRGQNNSITTLQSGEMLAAVNFRSDPAGIYLWRSRDGHEWEDGPLLRLWDPVSQRMVLDQQNLDSSQNNDGVWEALQHFSFGTPTLIDMHDGSMVLTYYATCGEHTRVRVCRFSLEKS